MTPELTKLARRAVACKGWRWMPGMLAVEQAVPGMALSTRPARVADYWHEVGVWLPELTDPATLGCLLALVREAWGDPTIVTAATLESDDSRCWITDCWNPHSPVSALITCPTEAHALVAALEAAP